jgi:hypothetical protein
METLITLFFALAALTSILLYYSFVIKPFEKERKNYKPWNDEVFTEAPTFRAHQRDEGDY